jgi:hypothetical protein
MPDEALLGCAARRSRHCRGTSSLHDVIIRLIRVTATSQHGPGLNAHFRDVAVPRIKACSGNAGVWYGRQAHREFEDFVMLSRWNDYDALHEWTGQEVNELPLLKNIDELATSWSVQHYEELDAEFPTS